MAHSACSFVTLYLIHLARPPGRALAKQWRPSGFRSVFPIPSALLTLKRSGHKPLEKGMWSRGAALELRMVLAGYEVGVPRQLYYFYQAVFIIHRRDD